MPIYFFNVSDGNLSFVDEKGKDLSDPHQAHIHTIRILEKMIHLIPDYITASCKINITLATGETVLTVIHPSLAFEVDARKKAG